MEVLIASNFSHGCFGSVMPQLSFWYFGSLGRSDSLCMVVTVANDGSFPEYVTVLSADSFVADVTIAVDESFSTSDTIYLCDSQ